jgi:tetratricopeptide (TPR) repeat protein
MTGRCAAAICIAASIVLGAQATTRAIEPSNESALPTTLAGWETFLQANPDDLQAGAAYRQAVIAAREFDRAIGFFKALVSRHPTAQNASINLAMAYVDKIPTAKGMSQPFLGRDAIKQFGRVLTRGPNWLAYYTRGLIYLYYKPFMRLTRPGVEDLERALALQRAEPRRPYHARTFVALGDGYWKLNDLARARKVWTDGQAEFPSDPALEARLAKQGKDLQRVIAHALNADVRQDTSLSELFAGRPAE